MQSSNDIIYSKQMLTKLPIDEQSKIKKHVQNDLTGEDEQQDIPMNHHILLGMQNN